MPSNSRAQKYVDNLEKLRWDNRVRLDRAAMRWNEYANNRSAELSKYLFTIASLVLPLSLLPVTQEGFTASDGNTWKIFLVLAWVLFVASLIFGLIHLAKEVKFFNGWARQENERGKVYSEDIFTTTPQVAFDRFEKMNKKSSALAKMPSTASPIFQYLQEGTLIMGIIFIGIVLLLKLFSGTENNLNWSQMKGLEQHNRILRDSNLRIW